jgi:endoglucanase
MLKDIGTGFNLGNTFDVNQNSTKLEDIRPIIDLYRRAGMRHVRIPVTWGGGFPDAPLADRQGRIDTRHPRLAAADGGGRLRAWYGNVGRGKHPP